MPSSHGGRFHEQIALCSVRNCLCDSAVATDIDARIDGFIATPGGRIWHVDWQEESATQICGAGCLEQDPDYAGAPQENLPDRYSFEDLQARGGSATNAQ